MKYKRTLITTLTGIAVLLGAVLTVPATRNALLGGGAIKCHRAGTYE